MKVQIYFQSGCYACVDTTIVSLTDDLQQDSSDNSSRSLLEEAFLDVTELQTKGLCLTRNVYSTGGDVTDVKINPLSMEIVLVQPEEIQYVMAIVVDGIVHFARINDMLVPVAADQILKRFQSDDEEDEDELGDGNGPDGYPGEVGHEGDGPDDEYY